MQVAFCMPTVPSKSSVACQATPSSRRIRRVVHRLSCGGWAQHGLQCQVIGRADMQVSISTVITIIDTARQEVCFVIAKLARGGPESSAPGWQVSCFTKGKNTRRTHANFPPPRPGPDSPGSRLAALGKNRSPGDWDVRQEVGRSYSGVCPIAWMISSLACV